jgi:hypothetical protein
MARYKEYSYSQGKFIPIHFNKQILPCTFEYTLNYLIDNEIDLSIFNKKYKNDGTGAPAYDPAILLKIVLYGYSSGSVLSRQDGTGPDHLYREDETQDRLSPQAGRFTRCGLQSASLHLPTSGPLSAWIDLPCAANER